MTSTELDRKAQDWAEVLIRVVPYESLYESYLTAASRHKDGPFKTGHIIAAWEDRKASLPVIQSQCLFCPRFMEDPSAPGSCVGDPTLPETCPFHSTAANNLH